MNFLGKLSFRRVAKVLAVAAVSGSLFFGGDVVNAAAQDGMWAFREAYLAQTSATRTFSQDFNLFSPNFHMDFDSEAQVFQDGSMRMSGNLTWTYTNTQKNYSTNNKIPFFVEQTNNAMTFYVQRNGRWNKMMLPGLPAGIALMWKSTDPAILQGNMDAVKAVELVRDTPDVRIMNVTLDGAKVADILQKNSAASFANLSGTALKEQQEIFSRWLAAFRSTDITFMWTVNKPTWETSSAVFDLTNILRAYSRHVLDESAAGRVVLTDEERELLDAMGYYSELKAYTAAINPNKAYPVNLPDDVKAAQENDGALDDIFHEMTTVVVNK
ncbi:MAG: hypothetical protein SR2Q5_08685 [Quinella sp. 2Q5]|nr:hypothetical protein [Quinella sp. 2Q5]